MTCGIRYEAAGYQRALDAREDLHGDIAWPLLADCELPSCHTLANNIFQPVEMHLGE